MKHVNPLSKGIPALAKQWQEFVCSANQLMEDALTAKGGASPLVSVVSNKCNLPTQS